METDEEKRTRGIIIEAWNISGLIVGIQDAQDAETKKALMSEMGRRRESLYELTGDKKQRRLADNCYRAAEYGFKRFE